MEGSVARWTMIGAEQRVVGVQSTMCVPAFVHDLDTSAQVKIVGPNSRKIIWRHALFLLSLLHVPVDDIHVCS